MKKFFDANNFSECCSKYNQNITTSHVWCGARLSAQFNYSLNIRLKISCVPLIPPKYFHVTLPINLVLQRLVHEFQDYLNHYPSNHKQPQERQILFRSGTHTVT